MIEQHSDAVEQHRYRITAIEVEHPFFSCSNMRAGPLGSEAESAWVVAAVGRLFPGLGVVMDHREA
jgi:hypothetical protein